MSKTVEILTLGTVPYIEGLELQKRLSEERLQRARPDTILLLDHPSTYTKGRRASEAELPRRDAWYAAQGIEIHDSDRGGQVTWHGPGQLVAYPIVDLQPYGDDVHLFVRRLEETMIAVLEEFEVEAGTIPGLTGVWTGVPELLEAGSQDPAVEMAISCGDLRKIGSIGIHVRAGITTHGFAINVECDLEPFSWIVPCGIENCRVTSVLEETGSSPGLEAVCDSVADRYCEVMDRRQINSPSGEVIRDSVGGAAAR